MTKAEVETLLDPPNDVTADGHWLCRSPAPGDSPHRLSFDAADLVTAIVVVSYGK